MAIKQYAKPLHVVAIPYPAQGHITPLLQLCEQLVPFGFVFTFINTHHIHQRLRLSSTHVLCRPRNNETFAHHRQDAHDAADDVADSCEDAYVPAHDDDACNGDDDVLGQEVYHYKGCAFIRMVCVPGGCAPEKLARISTAHEAFRAAQDMREPVENLLSCIIKEQAHIDFIMSDIVLGWSSATAQKFGVPWVSFWPASAASLSSFIYFSDLSSRGEMSIPLAEMEAGRQFLIPGLPPTHLSDVPKIWDAQGKLQDELLSYFKSLHHACLVLLNTFEDLEGQVLEALSMRFPICAIGPLLPSRYLLHTCLDSKQEVPLPLYRLSLFREDDCCLAWLDAQRPSSVIFISFGSISLRTTAQLQELAKGVEASGCPFLWVCKPDVSNELDNAHKFRFASHKNGPSRGLIVSWAPQLQVLSHPSIGGFITHCGWNSIIESVSLGVPMLCWADTTERMCNQRFVVEFWKCGIHMVADLRRTKQNIDEAVLIGCDDVEKSIRFLMLEGGGGFVRTQATKLRGAAIKAYQNSHDLLNNFVQTMRER